MQERNNQPEYDEMRVCEREIIYQDMLVCLKKENDLCLVLYESCKYFLFLNFGIQYIFLSTEPATYMQKKLFSQ